MVRLSNSEWAMLKEMARSLLRNRERSLDGNYWVVGDTLVDEEVALLRKLCSDVPDLQGLIDAMSGLETVTQSQYESALERFGIEAGSSELIAANSWMLIRGPKLVEG